MAATMSQGRRDTQIYGGLLLGCALLSMLVAAHHPTSGSHDLAAVMRALAARKGMIEGVHGGLLALFALQLVGFYGFARLLGLARPLPAAGLVLIAIGGMAMMAAGAINGFALPAFASTYPALLPGDVQAATAALRLCWALNQAMASIGAVAMGGAMLLWSLALAARTGWPRLVGALGIVAGAVIVGGISSGLLRLHVGGFIFFTLLFSSWGAAVALLMLTNRLGEPKAGVREA